MNVTLLENKTTQLQHAVDVETQAKVCGCVGVSVGVGVGVWVWVCACMGGYLGGCRCVQGEVNSLMSLHAVAFAFFLCNADKA